MTDTIIYIIFIILFILMILTSILQTKSNNKLEKIKKEIYELETDIMQKTLEQNKMLVNFINESSDSHNKWLDKHMDWTQKKPELTKFEHENLQLIIIFFNIFSQLYYITYWARNSLNSTGGKNATRNYCWFFRTNYWNKK